MSLPQVALSCVGVVKRYGSVIAVNGLDLQVLRGECFGLLGPNGAGKTTTIEILEGLLHADEGEVEVLGRRWGRDADRLRPRLGIQLQDTQLAERLTVAETLRMFRSFYPHGPTVDELLDTVELRSKRDAWVSKLSGGQKQRLSVACALAGDPELLFLDEPTTGLDPQSRRQLWAVLEQFGARGGTILITTHYMDEAHELCDRVGIMDHGKLIALGTPRELNIMGTGMWGVGFAVVRARSKKLLKRLIATPMKKTHYLLSLVLSRLATLTLEVVMIIGFAWVVFDVAVHGSIWALALLAVLGALTFGGLGLLVASRARTVEAVSGLMNLVMLPMWVLSGVFFAATNFPEAMQPFIQVLPLTALNDAMRAIVNEGRPLSEVWPQIGILAGWGSASFALSLRLFRWQ